MQIGHDLNQMLQRKLWLSASMLGGADLPYHKMAGSSGHASEDLETSASVYQVEAHQSDLSPLRELLLHDSDLTKWVRTE